MVRKASSPSTIRRRFWRLEVSVLVIFALVAVSLGWVVLHTAASGQDQLALESTQQIVRSLVRLEGDSLGKLALDYTYWDDAVANLGPTVDPVWADDNIGRYLNDNQAVDLSIVVSSDNQLKIAFVSGEPFADPELLERHPELLVLAAEARKLVPGHDQSPSAFAKIGGAVYQIAAHPLTPEAITADNIGTWQRTGIHQTVLILGRLVQSAVLPNLSVGFGVPLVHLELNGCTTETTPCLPLASPVGQEVAGIAYVPKRPGGELQDKTWKPVFALMAVFIVLLVWVFYRLSQDHARINIQNQALMSALNEVKTLEGLIPICSSCKKVRDEEGYWQQVEKYVQTHTYATFSHGICSQCASDLYGEDMGSEVEEVEVARRAIRHNSHGA